MSAPAHQVSRSLDLDAWALAQAAELARARRRAARRTRTRATLRRALGH